ncbi:hypothetical protein [Methyloversatilis discipulorum]|uniref:hypothetical protein n=1 Tax=Methyloversatilis discipulorum TaxID=1119528 RepID=UPI0026ED4C6E|nr:hypothetical protein [Methyloversatilis discipulorum]
MMALLDVSDILCDPDFMDTGLVCERLTQTIGANGRATNAPAQTSFAGVVTSDKGDLLMRIAEGERTVGSIIIHTRFALQDGRPGQTADVVIWQGRRFTVSAVQDWSHFGRGFVMANCDLLPLQG